MHMHYKSHHSIYKNFMTMRKTIKLVENAIEIGRGAYLIMFDSDSFNNLITTRKFSNMLFEENIIVFKNFLICPPNYLLYFSF